MTADPRGRGAHSVRPADEEIDRCRALDALRRELEAVIELLVRAGVIDADELSEAVRAEAGEPGLPEWMRQAS